MRLMFLLALLILLFGPLPVHAAPFACPRTAAPAITVQTDLGEPFFDFSIDTAGLNRKFAAIKAPSPQIYHLTIGSVMTGSVLALHKANIHQTTDPVTRKTCLTIDTIAVTLQMRPRIFMATELRKTGCEYKALFEHELKHVKVDRDILQAYTSRIHDGLAFAFAGDGDTRIGPFPEAQTDAGKAVLEERVNGAILNLLQLLMQERLDRQRLVDGPGEYARLSNAC